jgi:hypothetical protein
MLCDLPSMEGDREAVTCCPDEGPDASARNRLGGCAVSNDPTPASNAVHLAGPLPLDY